MIPNDRLLQLGDAVSVMDAFSTADEVLLAGVRASPT